MRERLFADYFQVRVLDELSDAEIVNVWSEGSLADRLVSFRDSLFIRTEVDVDVEVSVDWVMDSPELEAGLFDHIVEVSLEIASGKMVLMGCSDYFPEAPRVDVCPGWIRLRIQKSNLRNAVEADLESDESPETIERISISAWPEGPSAVRVLKRWRGVEGA